MGIWYIKNMKFYLQEKVEKARKLRKKGLSFQNIGKKISVSEIAVRRWCLDIPNNNRAFLGPLRKREEIKKSEVNILDRLQINQDLSKAFVALLYWAEGAKYPHSSTVSFSNSDPSMVFTFVQLLRSGFPLDEAKFRAHLQLHSTHNIKEIYQYWSKLLKIPIKQFWKPTITNPTKNMKRRDYKGTCTVRYNDYRILLKLIGIYESFARRIYRMSKQ